MFIAQLGFVFLLHHHKPVKKKLLCFDFLFVTKKESAVSHSQIFEEAVFNFHDGKKKKKKSYF